MKAIDFIKQNLTKEKIIALLEEKGASHMLVSSTEIRCTCPIHGGNNPSAFVWIFADNLWYCYTGCQCGGDIFTFVSHTEDISEEHEFRKLVQRTAELLGLDIANLELGERAETWRRELREWLKYVTRNNKPKNRPFDIATIGTLYKINEYRGFDRETLDYYDVAYSQTMNRIVFKIKDEEGNLVGVSCRTAGDEKPKWLHRPKHMMTGDTFWNLDKCNTSFETITLVEGMFDVMNLVSLGHGNVVATFGAHLTDEQAELVLKYFTDVYLLYDNDKAGFIATRKAIEKLKNKVNLFVGTYVDNSVHDPGELTNLEQIKFVRHHEWLKNNS